MGSALQSFTRARALLARCFSAEIRGFSRKQGGLSRSGLAKCLSRCCRTHLNRGHPHCWASSKSPLHKPAWIALMCCHGKVARLIAEVTAPTESTRLPLADPSGRTCADKKNLKRISMITGCGDDPGEFSLEDALGPVWPTPKRPSKPAGGTGGRDFDLADYFDSPVEPTKPARPTARPFPRPGKPDNGFWDVIRTTTTKRPKTTQTPRKQNPGKDPLDLDLADALGDRDDARDGRQPAVRPEEGFSDSDLEGIVDDGYSPDKKKGSGGNTDSQDNRVETGTIAGIASALAMALVGAVSSYISYQQKKFCFSIQQGLNAEYVKGENMEAVVSEEPQVKYSVLETQSAEPPKHDGAKA